MSNSKNAWFFLGQTLFGLLIGLLVGLSISPIVGTVVGLLFAFIGGSIIMLVKGKTDEQLTIIGISVSVLSISMILGVALGMWLRIGDPFSLNTVDISTYKLESPLSIEEITKYGADNDYKEIICHLVKSSNKDKKQTILTKEDVINLFDKKVNKEVIHAMFLSNSSCQINKSDKTQVKPTANPHLMSNKECSDTLLKGQQQEIPE